uniref:Uncharacterized protein n=1 Tax=Lepeophtheirus salmonis TaxID=72036 RepID=A0A0K2TDH7_LEPSM
MYTNIRIKTVTHQLIKIRILILSFILERVIVDGVPAVFAGTFYLNVTFTDIISTNC